MLLCPVCAQPLNQEERVATCANGHSFNRAKEGYLNLLRSSKAGDTTGDPKAAARSRRDFLNQGYYEPLRAALAALVTQQTGARGPLTLLDICCGEGYYTSALGAIPNVEAYGFDLAKEMVRLAAKRGGATYFVANLKAIPIADASVNVATHLFAPFNEREFARVLRPGGVLYTVIPGKRHLFGLKEAVYDTPYENDEKLPATETLRQVNLHRVSARIVLRSQEDIAAVFQMTPYYYRTRPSDRAKLDRLSTLETDIEFVIGEYRKLG